MSVEQEFIVDAVVGFLSSPIWNTPVRSFIEQNSLGMRNCFFIFFKFFFRVRLGQFGA